MKKMVSAGVVVYYDNPSDGERVYLLLQYPKGYWDLPKGKLENQETRLEAAIRELKEETNLDAEIHPGFEELLSYTFRGFDKELIVKEVTFFLGRAKNINVILSEEHLDYLWLPYKQAIEQLTYQNAKKTLEKAQKFLEGVND